MGTKYPPGKFGHPFSGNLKDLRLRILDFFCSLREKYGDVSTIRFSIRRVSYVQNPDVIQHILQENNRNYTKSLRYEQLKYLLGNGLLTNEGEFWLRQRRMIQPGFHNQKIASLFNEMLTCTDDFIKRISDKKGETFDISKEFMALTLQIVGRTLLGADVKSDAKAMADSLGYLLWAVNIRTRTPVLLPLWVPVPRHIKVKKCVRTINKILDHIFEERRKNPKNHNDLLNMLMEATYEDDNSTMSNKQLRDEVMTLFVAGHETTANALSWTVMLLGKHPEVAEKCRQEISTAKSNGDLSYESLRSLQYLTMVIEESMRLYPPAWVFGRKTILPDKLGEYTVPARHNLLISPFALHRDKRYWDNPEAFIPERFHPDSVKTRPKFAYLPFGGGPRLCIGNNFAMMEMQIVLAELISNFEIITDPSRDVIPDPLITLRPKNGVRVQLKSLS